MVKIELKYLFSPGKIGQVQINNRIVRSATYERRAAKYGKVTEELIELYRDLAEGGTGLIITGAIAVDPKATGGPDQPYLYDNSYIEGQKRLVFRFGTPEKEIKDKLYERDLVLEFEQKVVYEN